MSSLEKILKLFGRANAKPSDLASSLDECPQMLAEATAKRDELIDRRRGLLITGSDAELAMLDAEIAAAGRNVDRVQAVADELKVRSARAEEDARRAEAQAIFDDATKARDTIAERLRAEYPRHAGAILDLLRALHDSDGIVRKANARMGELGVDLPALATAEEIVRVGASAPREVLSTEIVEKWIVASSGADFTGDTSKIEFDHAEGAHFYQQSPNHFRSRVELRRFRRETFLPPVGQALLPSLAETVVLPALVGGERDIWRMQTGRFDQALGFESSLAALETAPERAPLRREPKISLTPIADDKSDGPPPIATEAKADNEKMWFVGR